MAIPRLQPSESWDCRMRRHAQLRVFLCGSGLMTFRAWPHHQPTGPGGLCLIHQLKRLRPHLRGLWEWESQVKPRSCHLTPHPHSPQLELTSAPLNACVNADVFNPALSQNQASPAHTHPTPGLPCYNPWGDPSVSQADPQPKSPVPLLCSLWTPGFVGAGGDEGAGGGEGAAAVI